MSKFKKDDIITLINNPNDKAIQQGIQGFYKIIEVTSSSYGVYSLFNKYYHTHKDMENMINNAHQDYKNIVESLGIEETNKQYPVHPGRHSTVKELI